MAQDHHNAAVFFRRAGGRIGNKENPGPGKRKYFIGIWNIKHNAVLAFDLFKPLF